MNNEDTIWKYEIDKKYITTMNYLSFIYQLIGFNFWYTQCLMTSVHTIINDNSKLLFTVQYTTDNSTLYIMYLLILHV